MDRAIEIENQLDYISRQLGQLKITETLPDVDLSSQHLVNCAMDVRSAVMKYLAVVIRYESKTSGVVCMMFPHSLLTGPRESCAYIPKR